MPNYSEIKYTTRPTILTLNETSYMYILASSRAAGKSGKTGVAEEEQKAR